MSPPVEHGRTVAGAQTAVAYSNIALCKYWGKADVTRNLPAVPSLSLTLRELSTTTSVAFDPDLTADHLWLNGQPVTGIALSRVSDLLDRVRQRSGLPQHASVRSENDFPTAAGLASSASGFAALALASSAAAGLPHTSACVSRLAREASVSAARSAYGGFVRLAAGGEIAEPIEAPAAIERLRMVIALTATGAKATSSTRGMLRTQQTSPYYPTWCSDAPAAYEQALAALLARDFERLGEAMEHSTLMMHASMLAARPPLVYLNGATLDVIACVQELRAAGTFAYFTMDAGPHVKVLTLVDEQDAVALRLSSVPGVVRVIRARPGPGAHLAESA